MPPKGVIARRVNEAPAGERRIVIERHASTRTDLTVRMNMDAVANDERAGSDDRAEVVDAGIVTDADVVKSNDFARLGDRDILADLSKAKPAQFLCLIIPRIEWISHLVVPPASNAPPLTLVPAPEQHCDTSSSEQQEGKQSKGGGMAHVKNLRRRGLRVQRKAA